MLSLSHKGKLAVSKSVLEAKCFHDEEAAYAWVEARVWPEGPVCPHCGGVDRISKMGGKSTRVGTYKCYQCRKPFTVKVGTVFESSHVPMRFWLQAMFLMASSKKGISTNQLHRTLGVTLKTAWFMSHRIRLAMKQVGLMPMGGAGETVEVDETFFGQLEGQPKRSHGSAHKNIVLTLVQRGGTSRSFHVEGTRLADIGPILRNNIAPETTINTDQGSWYRWVGKEFAGHSTVDHSREEYARYEGGELISTNTVEGFYSVFKRGMRGIYQHC